MRRMHLRYLRRLAPEVLATARAQRWDPAEVLKVLLGEEVAGRERSALATRRARAAFPTGKTFHTWAPNLSSIPSRVFVATRRGRVPGPGGENDSRRRATWLLVARLTTLTLCELTEEREPELYWLANPVEAYSPTAAATSILFDLIDASDRLE